MLQKKIKKFSQKSKNKISKKGNFAKKIDGTMIRNLGDRPKPVLVSCDPVLRL